MEKYEYYFVINEVGNSDGGHIGIIRANNSDDFNQKLRRAIDEHFNPDSLEIKNIELSSILNYEEQEFTVALTEETDDEGNEALISIQRSWIY